MISIINKKVFVLIICFLVVGSLTGCLSYNNELKKSYSFENNFSNWGKGGKDLEHPSNSSKTISWSIKRIKWNETIYNQFFNSSAIDGEHVLRFQLDNINDAGKIWIEKSFDLKENQSYLVNLSFDFGTTDYGVNQWTIIAGSDNPSKGKSSLPFQGKTGKGTGEPGFAWLNKSYSFERNSGENGKIKIMIGVWGTWETKRTYLIDNVTIHFKPL